MILKLVKSDDKFKYEDEEGKEQEGTFTNFELLEKKVDILMVMVNQQAEIMKQNKLFEKRSPTTISDEDIYSKMLEAPAE